MTSDMISAIVFLLTGMAALVCFFVGLLGPAIALLIISAIAFWGANFSNQRC